MYRDVNKGRRELNFSEWHERQKEAHESPKLVQKESMPPWYYPWARLSSAERQALMQGLAATVGTKEDGREDKYAERHGAERDRD